MRYSYVIPISDETRTRENLLLDNYEYKIEMAKNHMLMA